VHKHAPHGYTPPAVHQPRAGPVALARREPGGLALAGQLGGREEVRVVPSWRRHRLGARRCAGGILHVVDSAMSGALGSAP